MEGGSAAVARDYDHPRAYSIGLPGARFQPMTHIRVRVGRPERRTPQAAWLALVWTGAAIVVGPILSQIPRRRLRAGESIDVDETVVAPTATPVAVD